MKVKCFNCGREKIFENEGRFIDGSWKEDELFLKRGLAGVWICSWNCYQLFLNILKLLEPKPIFKNNGGIK